MNEIAMRTILKIENLRANGKEEQRQQQPHSQIHTCISANDLAYEHVEFLNTRKYSIVVVFAVVVAIAGWVSKCTYVWNSVI